MPLSSAKLPATFATVPLPATLVAWAKVIPSLLLALSSKPAAPVTAVASAAVKPLKPVVPAVPAVLPVRLKAVLPRLVIAPVPATFVAPAKVMPSLALVA